MSPESGVLSWQSHPVAVGVTAAVALLALKWATAKPRASFALEPRAFAPGETVRGTLLTEARPTVTKAACGLYRADSDRPERELTVRVGEPVRDHDGWRTPVEADLPADARPAFEGGWAFSLEARAGSHSILEGDSVELASFWLEPGSHPKPGGEVRAVLFSEKKPAALEAELVWADKVGEEDAARTVKAVVGRTEKTPTGWLTSVEAALPADALSPPPGDWVLRVGGDCDGEPVDEEVAVTVA